LVNNHFFRVEFDAIRLSYDWIVQGSQLTFV
jgi:hypothetical protein